MDSNTLLVIGVDGGLILFFLYALYVVNQYPSSGKLKVSAQVKPERTFVITQLEPDLSSIARAKSEPIPEPEPSLRRSDMRSASVSGQRKAIRLYQDNVFQRRVIYRGRAAQHVVERGLALQGCLEPDHRL